MCKGKKTNHVRTKISFTMLLNIMAIIFALSGWGTFYYEYLSAKPNIEGEVILEGRSSFYNDTDEFMLFNPYLFLTNTRSNSVYIKTIDLEFEFNNELITISPYYQISELNIISISDSIDNFHPHDLVEHNLFYQDLVVSYGKAIKGYICFPIKSKQHFDMLATADYKLIVKDIFNREYIVKRKRRKNETIDFDWFMIFSDTKVKNVENIKNLDGSNIKNERKLR